MKLLIIGGMHGNEYLGIQLVKSLKSQPIAGVDALIANPRAVKQGARFTESDLNRSFGQQTNDTYEKKRASKLTKIIADYDVVLDFHNTQTSNNNCCFVGIGCNPELYQIAKRLQFDACIEATYDCVNKFAPNTISIEISIGDERDSVEYWRKAITALVDGKRMSDTRSLIIYRYLQRVTWQQQKSLNLSDWKPFVLIARHDKQGLAISGEIVPIFIGSHLTEYYATLLTKINDV